MRKVDEPFKRASFSNKSSGNISFRIPFPDPVSADICNIVLLEFPPICLSTKAPPANSGPPEFIERWITILHKSFTLRWWIICASIDSYLSLLPHFFLLKAYKSLNLAKFWNPALPSMLRRSRWSCLFPSFFVFRKDNRKLHIDSIIIKNTRGNICIDILRSTAGLEAVY